MMDHEGIKATRLMAARRLSLVGANVGRRAVEVEAVTLRVREMRV